MKLLEPLKKAVQIRKDFFLDYSNMKVNRNLYPESVLSCDVSTLNTPLTTPGFLTVKIKRVNLVLDID